MSNSVKKGKSGKFFLRPGAIIAISFLLVILVGSVLLICPFSLNDGASISYIDSLFTSVSAVCVTGLISADAYDTFNIFGRIVLAILIQVGGLGVTTFSIGLILISNGNLSVRQSTILKEAWNIDTFKDLKSIFIKVLLYTLVVEVVGAFLSVISFAQHMPLDRAFGTAFFHSIAAFNNSGFDILGGYKSLFDYRNDVFLNIVTCLLIMLGGIGFLVVLDMIKCKFNIKKFKLHTKIVLLVSVILWVLGFFLIKLCEWDNISWLGSWFFSVSSRTAGFSTFPIGDMKQGTLLVIIFLMFVGAAPGSTGGGIKVTTFFVIMLSIKSTITSSRNQIFKRSIKDEIIKKAFGIVILGIILVGLSTFAITAIEGVQLLNGRTYDMMDYFFECVSAFGTVGLSTGFTPFYSWGSKLIFIVGMFIGRLGPMTIATLWKRKENLSTARYLDESISIG